MGVRRKGREYALQALYLHDLTKLGMEKVLRSLFHKTTVEAKIREFTVELAEGAAAHRDELDELIIKVAKNWEMKRMAALDRNLLRMSAYEILHKPDTPVSVIIDEAVEIAKEFSTDKSGKFVNGILDKIKNERTDKKD